jgi:group I intron endonuclease
MYNIYTIFYKNQVTIGQIGVNLVVIIYRIVNLLNNKCYIGQTINNFKRRYWGDGKWYKHTSSPYLKNSAKKYGVENFRVELIEENVPTLNELNRLEEYYIKKYNCIYPNGYNFKPGGSNKNHHNITKNKISEALAKDWIFKNNKTNEIVKIHNLANFCRINKLARPMMMHVASRKRKRHREWTLPETVLKKWIVKSPNGEIFTILEGELRPFCRKHKLHKSALVDVCKGIYKQYLGWTKP